MISWNLQTTFHCHCNTSIDIVKANRALKELRSLNPSTDIHDLFNEINVD